MRPKMGSLVFRAVITLIALCAALPGTAGAQGAEPPDFSLQLVTQPPWHLPGDPLGVTVRVVNHSQVDLDGYRIQVAGHDRITSRSDLHVSFEGRTGVPSASITDTSGLEKNIPAGESADIELDMPVADLLPVDTIVDGGVYPLSVRIYDSTGFTLLAELVTHLLYYPEDPERPLRTVVVVALNDLPSRGPDGTFEPGPDGAIPLEDALSDSGWLSGALEAMLARTEPEKRRIELPRARRGRRGSPRPRFRTITLPPLEIGLAPTPRLLEELADMDDGYVRETESGTDQVGPGDGPAQAAGRALTALQDLAARDSVQTLLVPYANPDLPTLAAQGENLLTQVDLGAEIVGSHLEVDVDRNWLFPPAGRLDEAALEDLGEADDAGNTFLEQAALDTPIDPSVVQCPHASPTFACAISVEAEGHRSLAFLLDQDVNARFAELTRNGSDRLDLQNLLAETAMIHAELPGTLDRALHFVIPSTWHPRPHAWKLMMHALTRAPWLDTQRPVDALDNLPVVDMDLDDQAPEVENAPDTSFYDLVDRAEELIDHLKSLGAPGSTTTQLDRNLLVAQSRVWWIDPALLDRAESYIRDSESEAHALFRRIRLRGPDEITLTSRRGKIQLVVSNEGDFPVRLSVVLRSLPLGGARLEPDALEVSVPEGTQRQLDIDAIAQTSGIFSLEANVMTAEGDGYVIETKRISVRSTAYNLIALGLTIGALLFLILFYATRAFRRSGPQNEAES